MTLFENILEEKEQDFQPRRLIYSFVFKKQMQVYRSPHFLLVHDD